MNVVDEILVCEIDTENKHVKIPCPTRGDRIAVHAIAFSIAGEVVLSNEFDFEGDAPIGCETLRKYLSEHFVKLHDVQGRQIPDGDLTGYDWDVYPMPMVRGDEWAGAVLNGQ